MPLVVLGFLIVSFLTFAIILTAYSDGQKKRALRILLTWAGCAAVYAGFLLIRPFLRDDQPLRTGIPYCEDDVCMSIDSVALGGDSCRLAVRFSSRAHHGPRSAGGASFRLVDERNRRFEQEPDPNALPADTAMEPGGSFATTLRFHVPAGAAHLWLQVDMDHIGYATFIIGAGDLDGKSRLRVRIG